MTDKFTGKTSYFSKEKSSILKPKDIYVEQIKFIENKGLITSMNLREIDKKFSFDENLMEDDNKQNVYHWIIETFINQYPVYNCDDVVGILNFVKYKSSCTTLHLQDKDGRTPLMCILHPERYNHNFRPIVDWFFNAFHERNENIEQILKIKDNDQQNSILHYLAEGYYQNFDFRVNNKLKGQKLDTKLILNILHSVYRQFNPCDGSRCNEYDEKEIENLKKLLSPYLNYIHKKLSNKLDDDKECNISGKCITCAKGVDKCECTCKSQRDLIKYLKTQIDRSKAITVKTFADFINGFNMYRDDLNTDKGFEFDDTKKENNINYVIDLLEESPYTQYIITNDEIIPKKKKFIVIPQISSYIYLIKSELNISQKTPLDIGTIYGNNTGMFTSNRKEKILGNKLYSTYIKIKNILNTRYESKTTVSLVIDKAEIESVINLGGEDLIYSLYIKNKILENLEEIYRKGLGGKIQNLETNTDDEYMFVLEYIIEVVNYLERNAIKQISTEDPSVSSDSTYEPVFDDSSDPTYEPVFDDSSDPTYEPVFDDSSDFTDDSVFDDASVFTHTYDDDSSVSYLNTDNRF